MLVSPAGVDVVPVGVLQVGMERRSVYAVLGPQRVGVRLALLRAPSQLRLMLLGLRHTCGGGK